MRTGRVGICWTAIVLMPVLLMGCGRESDDVSTTQVEVVEETSQDDGAGEAIRELLLAMLDKDEARIRALTLANPKVSVLWGGPQVAEAERKVGAQVFEKLTFRDLAVGDKAPMPDGRVQEITASDIDDDNRLILAVFANGETMPVPFVVKRVGDGWKVDASPLIFARIGRLRVQYEEAQRRKAQFGPPLPPRPGAPTQPPAADPTAEPPGEPPSEAPK